MLLSTFNKELYEKELKNDAYNEGEANGLVKGRQQKLIELIQIKLTKGKSIETIADELEEPVEIIQDLISQISTK